MTRTRTALALALALALSLGLVAGANATTISPIPQTYASTVLVNGSFLDTYNFTITSPLYSSGYVFSNETSTLSISGLTVELWTGIYGDADTTNDKLKNTLIDKGIYKYGAGTYSPGDYFYKIYGKTAGSSGGAYTISIITQPVPEPETYAMLLAGLGLMGTVARRRRTKAV